MSLNNKNSHASFFTFSGKGFFVQLVFSPSIRSAEVLCSLNAPRIGRVKIGFWLMGKLGNAWVGAWYWCALYVYHLDW